MCNAFSIYDTPVCYLHALGIFTMRRIAVLQENHKRRISLPKQKQLFNLNAIHFWYNLTILLYSAGKQACFSVNKLQTSHKYMYFFTKKRVHLFQLGVFENVNCQKEMKTQTYSIHYRRLLYLKDVIITHWLVKHPNPKWPWILLALVLGNYTIHHFIQRFLCFISLSMWPYKYCIQTHANIPE